MERNPIYHIIAATRIHACQVEFITHVFGNSKSPNFHFHPCKMQLCIKVESHHWSDFINEVGVVQWNW